MPSGDTHAAVTKAILRTTDGRLVQKIMDSTAGEHGPSHRHDHVHSLEGVAMELAKRGQLTGENMAAAMLHQMTDEAFTRFGRTLPAGTPRRVGKLLLEDLTRQVLRRR